MKIECDFNLSTFIMLKSCLVKTFTLNYPPPYMERMYLRWWPSWFDRGALINVDAPECGSRLDAVQVGRFTSWDTAVTKAESAYFLSRISHSVVS